MEFAEAVRIAVSSLWAHKLRSVLTLLGVVIGITSVIAVVSLINGLNSYVAERVFTLGADVFIISTDADRVYLDFKKPGQRPIAKATVSEMQAHLEGGQFPPGNMGPKIESALRFLRAGGREVIITSYERLLDAVRGEAGTHIVPD